MVRGELEREGEGEERKSHKKNLTSRMPTSGVLTLSSLLIAQMCILI